MLTFDEDTGNILIEFPDAPNESERLITVRPPKYGALKRLRAERERIANEANRKLEALPTIPDPIDTDDPEEAKADAEERTRLGNERIKAITDANEQTMGAWWRFVLIGDDTFKGLADKTVPLGEEGHEYDDWPSELLIDWQDPMLPPGLRRMVVDRMFDHWGKVRSHSGPKA